MISSKLESFEKVSVRSFCTFCRNNAPLVLAVSFTLVFTYGIKLFCYTVGVDTELFLADKVYLLGG